MKVRCHSMGETLLLVDDDAGFRSVYRSLLGDDGYRVVEAADRDGAARMFVESSPRLVVLDLMLPPTGKPEEGAALCEKFLASIPACKVVIVSGSGDTRTALAVVERGAYDFLTKPIDPEVLIAVLRRASARLRLEDRVAELESTLAAPADGSGLLGSSPALSEARALCDRAAPTEVAVLITGATGTGKEVFARYLHARSRRAAGPFVAVNCGALNAALLESTLFGHKKGAFTGAIKDEPGLFVAASGGTLFLDEIGDMDPALQVKLLRALEEGEVLPVGASKPVPVDVRVVSATHQPLPELAGSGRFRDDLYWRIRGIEIHLPPLADREGDLEVLSQHFLNRARALVPGAGAVRISAEAMRCMESYAWPGNLRELRHEMQRALVMAAGRAEILAADLSPGLRQPFPAAAPECAEGATLEEQIAALERREIARALERTGGNKSQAAQALGLSRQGLANKMSRHGLT